MQHEEFAERVTERLEAVARAVEDRDRELGDGTVSVRANEIRVAARMVRDSALAVTQAEGRASPGSPAEGRLAHGASTRKRDWRQTRRTKRTLEEV